MLPTSDTTGVRCGAAASYLFVKHFIDWYVALAAVVFAAPLFVLIGCLIRRESDGPIFFRQTRAGRNGRPFTLYKFRTMRTDADPYGDSPQSGEDPRITRVGKWLREKSLDELPQLFNVLRREMSLVGPRPLYVQQMAEWDDRQKARLLVKPGLTGLAQISGRGSLTIEEKLEWDVQYVEQVSCGADLGIIWRTLRGDALAGGIYEVRYSKDKLRRTDD